MQKILDLIRRGNALLEQQRVRRLLAAAMVGVFTTAYTLLVLNRYWQFEFFFVDNVFFHAALWKMAHFQAPIVFHRILGDINIFGDHFHPTIMILSLLMMIVPRNETVLVAMTVFYGAAAWVGYLIAEKLIKNFYLVMMLLFAFFTYLGTQYAMIYGFHEINLMPLFFFLAVYGWVVKKNWLYWLGIVLLLLTKESMVAVVAGLALFLIVADRKEWKRAGATLAVAVGYYFLVTKAIIPYFSHGQFLYKPEIPGSPGVLIDRLLNPPEKRETFMVSMGSFGFLPFLNVAAWPLLFQDFLLRYVFAIPGNVQYTLTFHYGVALVPLLFFSSVWSAHRMQSWKFGKYLTWGFLVLLTLSNLYFLRFYTRKGALLMAFNPTFYHITQQNKFLWKLVDITPKDGRIMTQNHLGLAFSEYDVHPLAETYDQLIKVNPKYIVYDNRAGQNPNNYFPNTEDGFKKLTERLLTEKKYAIQFHEGSLFVLQRVE